MIAAYSCFLSQAFPLPLLKVTPLFSFCAFVFEGKQCFVDFISCCLIFFLVQSTFKGKVLNTCALILYLPFQIPLSTRFRGVDGRGVLPHPRCRLLPAGSSKLSPRWTLRGCGPAWMPCEGIKLVVGGCRALPCSGLCPVPGDFPNQMSSCAD